ncbi:MAG: YihA family ribosome biogenesis GTP-binding protein [Clostridiales bacterium]|nr:YihA family ribosome biogenesis GTP-binding protein [Clostridiales bacterium]
MTIKRAYYIKSAVDSKDFIVDELPQVVLVGKSNVGKSSFINCIANNRKLAHISGQPGKTRTVNYYKMNDDFYTVDLPGYGYARVSKKEQLVWGDMIDRFLYENANIAAIFHILDIRHPPTELDRKMGDWLKFYELPLVGIATKADKLGKTRWNPRVESIRKDMGWSQFVPIIPFSSVTGQGKDRALELMGIYLGNYHSH